MWEIARLILYFTQIDQDFQLYQRGRFVVSFVCSILIFYVNLEAQAVAWQCIFVGIQKLWNAFRQRLKTNRKLNLHYIFTANLAPTSSALVLLNTEFYLQKFDKVASGNVFLEQQDTKNKKKKKKENTFLK